MALNTVPSLVATTAVVTLFAFRDDVGAVEAVAIGVAGAVVGRVLFALAVRHGADRFIRGRLRRNIDFLRDHVGRKRHATRFAAGIAVALVPLALAAQVDWQMLVEQRRVRLLPRASRG